MLTTQQALQRYHQHFDNAHYQKIAACLAQDLAADRSAPPVSDMMNGLTNAALQLCGYPGYDTAWLTLATRCGDYHVRVETIEEIASYLRRFQRAQGIIVADFERTALAYMVTRSWILYVKRRQKPMAFTAGRDASLTICSPPPNISHRQPSIC